MDKTIRRITDAKKQEAETYRYWQSRPVGERLVAVCELSEAAYSLKTAFKGAAVHDRKGASRCRDGCEARTSSAEEK